ncbi:hypothetical protein IAU60_001648 [Kwoniella sp. DSM 27419]
MSKTPKVKKTVDADQLVTGIQTLSIAATPKGLQETLDGCPPRPDYGKVGRPLTVNANMYLTRFKAQGAVVNHYDIDINPVVKVANQKKPRPLMQKVWDQMCSDATGEIKKVLDAAAYDQVKNFYSPFDLPMAGDKLEIVVALQEGTHATDDESRRFKAIIRLAQKIDLDTIVNYCSGNRQTEQARTMMMTAIQAMNILFRQDPAQQYAVSGAAGRRFFTEHDGTLLSNGGILYKGFQQSFRWTSANYPALQLDTAYSAFVQPGPMPDVCARVLGMGGSGGGFGGRGGGRGGRGFDRGGSRGGRGGGLPQGIATGGFSITEMNESQIKRLNDVLRMAKFKVTHRQTDRVFTMTKITFRRADELKFAIEGTDGSKNRMVTVPQYFKEKYNVTVTKPRLPCIQYGKGSYLPLEFAILLPFHSIPFMRITPEQTAEMTKPPPERQAAINAWRQKLNYQNLPKLKAWGVQVQPAMMQIPARVLQAPPVVYADKKSVGAGGGSWRLRGNKFCKPGNPLKSWAIVSFDERTGIPDLGCPVINKQPPLFHLNPNQRGPNSAIKEGLQTAAKQAFMTSKLDPQLIVVILPRKDPTMYQTIKATAAPSAEGLHKPVVTQCLQAAKISNPRGLDMYCENVAMKIHAKLGGITHQVQHQIERNTMMIGADVTHPPPKGGALPPSIAVTVCAINGENNKFSPALRLQDGRVEIIQDLENMVHSHIVQFEKNTKTKPDKILFFRDGVSEGQYAHCVKQEVAAIKRAAARFDVKGGYQPKVTFVICAKRHAMRFFALDQKDMDKTGNLPAGSIVDQKVTSPMIHDFYLQAHAGLQGTARPTHYVVVADENKYTADKLQGLVNNLCYSYARATRSVSLVPVVYYADIIAEKARDMIYASADDSTDGAQTVASGSSGPAPAMTFDPLRLQKRIEGDAAFNSVAWYM